jgi:ribosomal protein S18 acetylase RimI-like enzyme
MSITKASPTDLDTIMSLIRQAIAVMYQNGIDQWNEDYPGREIIAGDIETGTLFKITDRGQIAGIIVLNNRQSPEYGDLTWQDQSGNFLIVHRLCLHPAFQGKGLSKQMMGFAEEHALKNGCTSIRLDTYNKNYIALKLYDSLGYRRVGTVSFRPGKTFQCFEKVIKLNA